jgi:Domain of unknown function (DUF4175)
MNYEGNKLTGLLRAVRGRRRLLLALRGAAVCLAVGALSLLLLGWAAHRYRHSEATLLALRLGALFVLLATAYLSLVRPLLKRVSDARLARLIEEKTPGAEERLVTAVEFYGAEHERRISAAIVKRLAADADQLAATVRLDNVIGRRALTAYGLASLCCLLLFVSVLKWGPGSISEGVAQLVAPSSLASSNNSQHINVKPGTARVPKGSDQEITATLFGFDAQQVTIFSRRLVADGATAAEWQGQAMEPGKELQRFQFSIFNIQESVEYFVETGGIRTETFRLEVADLPFVKQLDLVLSFPAYTRIAAKTIEDGGDIAALKGTVATVTARLSGKAGAARLVFADGRKIEMRADGADFVGSVTVAADTSYYIELVSREGEAYRGSNEYDITVLEDAPPTITFERPGRDTKATNLEEVFTQARAEDDYGVSSVQMFFSVNGGAEQKINLQDLSRDAARSLTAAHTFFLEEFKLKPGDFISYYARARDAASETTSDIYFIEIKPFDMQYRQSQQQGGAAGGEGGGQDQNALTRRQKELIAATHRLMREGAKYAPQERTDAYEAVAAGQEKLRTDTLEFLDRLGRRLGEQLEGAEDLSRMAEHLRQAAREMEGAPPPLRKQSGRDALAPEQRALQQLLAADSIFRELQVAFGNQQGGGAGGEREQQELTDLFELELDKMKNQYETLQREQRAQAQRGKTEAERKLEELARRQQQALEGQRRQQAQARNNSSSGGSPGSQRQQQELIEETRRAARELERLSRERRDAQLQELSRQLNQAANEMQQAQASSQSNGNESIAQGERALERLEQARRRLQQGAGRAGREQEIGELRRRAAEAASRQREIAREVESLARRGAQGTQDEAAQNARRQLGERKDALADSVSNLEQDIEQSARTLGEGEQRAARQLSESAASLRRDRVAERIREGRRGLENNGPEAARAGERALERSLNELSERLQAAEQNAGRSAASNGEETLDRTRRLADNLESLRRRLDENGRRREGSARGQQQDQQAGRQGSSSSSAQQPQQGSASSSADTGGDDRQLGAELRQRLNDAADLRRAWGASGGPYRELDRAIEELRRMADGRMPGDAQTAAALKSQVIDPLRRLELELSRRLREQLGRTNLRLGEEGSAPERYRRSVEEYYRRLSGGGQR